MNDPSRRDLHILRYGCVVIVLLLSLHATTFAAVDSSEIPHPPESILFVGNLNFDCYQDTVAGWVDTKFRYLPRSIRWGRPHVRYHYDPQTRQIDTLPPDSSCFGEIPPSRRVAVTAIRYPEWSGLSGSVAFQRMNADSLDDMILYLWGAAGDPERAHDSTRALLIFGQECLDTLEMLDIAALEGFQVSPFIAMEMRKGSELAEPAIRDLSGVTSYLLAPVPLDLARLHGEGSPASAGEPRSMSVSSSPLHVRIYPNPATVAAQLAAESIPAGGYEVDIVSVNGLVVQRQSVSVTVSGRLFETLDLRSMASGYYIVRLHDRAHVLGVYPVIITR
jgi:hypothetical protein